MVKGTGVGRQKEEAERERLQKVRDKLMRDEVSRRLRTWALRAGLNQTDLGIAMGVGQPSASKWMRGVNGPSLYVLARLAKLYELDLNWLLTGKSLAGNQAPVTGGEEEPPAPRRGRPPHREVRGAEDLVALLADSGKLEQLLRILEALR